MISAALVADSGAALEAMTSSLVTVPGVMIVRHCHGRSPVGRSLQPFNPDLVLIDEMGWPKVALQRIAEVHELLPGTRIVVRAGRPEASWLAEALRAGASAVVPQTAGTETLGVVIREVTAAQAIVDQEQPPALAA